MLSFLLRLSCYLAVCALAYMVVKGYPAKVQALTALGFSVAGAWFFSRDVLDFVYAISQAGRRSAAEKWGGRYYTYIGAQVRLCLVDGTVWIVEEDVRDILSPPVTEREKRLMGAEHARIPGTTVFGYSEQGLLRLVAVRLMRRGGETDMKKFITWLEKEALPNVKRFPTSSTIQA